MARQVHWLKPAVCLLLIAALALPGCAMQRSVPAANVAAQFQAPAPASDKAAVLKYLKAALKDLAVIDEIIDDDDLGLMEDADPNSEETMSDEDAARYSKLLSGYSDDVNDAMTAIEKRETPKYADLVSFRAAELAEFALMSELLDEYSQVLGYYDLMMEMNDDMAPLNNLDSNSTDLEGIYKTCNEAISNAIDTMKNGDIPSCLKSRNDAFVVALNEANDAILYYLNALALDDPLREDAAEYRMNILMRKLDAISQELEQDLVDRQKKLTADAKSIQKTNDGLKQWLKSNIDKLN